MTSIQLTYLCNFRDNVDTKVLTKNVQLITEALARQIFNLNNSGTPQVFVEGLVSKL